VFSIFIGLLIKGRLDNTEVSIKYGKSMQRNWQHRVRKTKTNETKIQHNMCWTPLYASEHKILK
jgi:hypothetical protein